MSGTPTTLAAFVTLRHTVTVAAPPAACSDAWEASMPNLLLRLRALPKGSITEGLPGPIVDLEAPERPAPAASTLARWSGVAAAAHDACLVLDAHGRVLSLSAMAGSLLGCGTEGVAGRPLLELLDLVDFHTGESAPDYAVRVAPLAVLQEGAGLVRSLLRVRHPDGTVRTLDAAGGPLHEADGRLVGSVTLFAGLGG
jgi:PAS domain-containing protein